MGGVLRIVKNANRKTCFFRSECVFVFRRGGLARRKAYINGKIIALVYMGFLFVCNNFC